MEIPGIIYLVIQICTLGVLFWYAILTRKIANSAKASAEVTELALAAFTPSFSFNQDRIQSNRGKLVDNPAKEGYIFKFYLHNVKDIPGTVKLDFSFFIKGADGIYRDSRLKVFVNDTFNKDFYPEEGRLYDLQPREIVPIHALIGEAEFVEWIDKAYPGLANEITAVRPNITHRIDLITKRQKTNGNRVQGSNLMIKMEITAHSRYANKGKPRDKAFYSEKEFLICFEGTNHSSWTLRGERSYVIDSVRY